MIKKTIITLISMTIIASCSKREVPLPVHEGKSHYTPGETSRKNEDLFSIPSVDLIKENKQGQSSSQLDYVESLQKYINIDYVGNPQYSSSTNLRDILIEHNRALYQSLLDSPKETFESKVTKNFIQLIYSGCDSNLKGCLFFDFFYQDHNTSKILMKVAEIEGKKISELRGEGQRRDDYLRSVEEYYKHIRYSFDYKSRARDSDIESLIIAHIDDYLNYLASLPNKKMEFEKKRLGLIYELLLDDIMQNIDDPHINQKAVALVASFKPCRFSRRNANIFGYGETTILEIASKIYDQKKHKDNLEKCFNEAVSATQSGQYIDHWGPSFTADLIKLTKNNKSIFEKLNVKINEDYYKKNPKYFHIIDRVFRGHWTMTDGKMMYQMSEQNEAKFLEVLLSYIKVEVINMVVETNQFMNEIYTNENGHTSKSLFKDTIDYSSALSQKWQYLYRKINNVESFTRILFQKSDGNNSNAYTTTQDVLSSISRSSKFISIYPNMLLMVYNMVKLNFKVDVRLFFGISITLSAEDIVKNLFNGDIQPWFNFSNGDSIALNSTEILIAFYFALASNTFESFNNVSEEDFFEVVIGKYLEDSVDKIEDSLSDIERNVTNGTITQDTIKICKDEELPQDIPLNHLSSYTYMGAGESLSKYHTANFYNGHMLSSDLKYFRTTLENKITYASIMIDFYKKHLESNGSSQEDINNRISRIRKTIEHIKDMRSQYYSQILRYHSKFDKCVYKIHEKEWANKVFLFQKEKEYLSSVHDYMTCLNTNCTVDNKKYLKERIDEQSEYLLKNTLEGQSQSISQTISESITASRFTYSKLHILLRAAKNIALAPNKVNINMPPRLAENTLVTSYEDNSLGVRYQSDKNSFIQEALKRAWSSHNGSFIKWFSPQDIRFLHSKLEVMKELSMAKISETYDYSLDYFCQEKKSQKCQRIPEVSISELVYEVPNIIHFIDLTPEDKEILEEIGLPRKFVKSSLEALFFESGRPTYIFDNIYESIRSGNSSLELSKEYYLTWRDLGTFLFQPNKWVFKILRNHFRPAVVSTMKAITTFEDQVQKLSCDISSPNSKIDIPVVAYQYEPKTGEELFIDIPFRGSKPMLLNPDRLSVAKAARHKYLKEETGKFFYAIGDEEEVPENTMVACE